MSIIAEALKKAQEKRAQTFGNTSSRLENILAEKSELIPDEYKKSRKPDAPEPLAPIKKHQSSKHLRLQESLLQIFIAIFAIVAIFMAYTLFKGPVASYEQESISPAAAETPEVETESDETGTPASSNLLLGIISDTVKSIRPRTSSQKLRLPYLSGIMYSSHSPQAVVNGVLSSEGDTVGDFSIVKILPTSIVISFGEQEHEIKLR